MPSSDPYGTLRTQLGWARARLGGAPGTKAMEAELAARAPSPGEGRNSKPDPIWRGTIQPDAPGHPADPPPDRTEQIRAGSAALGVVLHQVVERVPEQDQLIAEHLEISEEGESLFGHHSLDRRHERHERIDALLAGVLLACSLLCAVSLLIAWGALHQSTELDERVRTLEETLTQQRTTPVTPPVTPPAPAPEPTPGWGVLR